MKVKFEESVPRGVPLREITKGQTFMVADSVYKLVYLKTEAGFVQLDNGTWRADRDAREDDAFYVVDAEVVVNG